MAWAVVRVRGTQNLPAGIRKTFELLRLNKKNHCVIVPQTKTYEGMLKLVKDWITWGEVDKAVLEKIVAVRGRLHGNKGIAEKDVSKVVEKILSGKSELKPVFRLNPPRRGFERKGTRLSFSQGGALGYRGKKINELLERMI